MSLIKKNLYKLPIPQLFYLWYNLGDYSVLILHIDTETLEGTFRVKWY